MEDVREGLAQRLRLLDAETLGDCGATNIQSWEQLSNKAKEFYYTNADQILSYLHSQGYRKVELEVSEIRNKTVVPGLASLTTTFEALYGLYGVDFNQEFPRG